MPMPDTRLDDKLNAAKFRAFGGLVISVEPHYCNIEDEDISQVQLSPVIVFNLGTRRVCEDVDVTWNLGVAGGARSYSPNYDPTADPDNLATYEIDWGDGNSTGVVAYPPGHANPPPSGSYGAAAGEWDLAGAAEVTFTITITLTDDDGNSTTIEEQISVVDCTAFPFMAYAGLKSGGGVYGATTWSDVSDGLEDGWLTVNDIDVNEAVVVGGNTELWVATNAGIAISRDGGESWWPLSIPDPPNSWNDAPAPTASTVIYYRFARRDSGRLFCIVYYTNGGLYRGYLLDIEGYEDFTWYNLAGDRQTVATWGYPDRIVSDWWCDEQEGASGDGSPVRTLVNPNNILVADGAGGGVRVDFTSRADNTQLFQRLLRLDFGTWLRQDAAVVDGGINQDVSLVASQDTMTWSVVTNIEIILEWSKNDWFQCDSDRQQTIALWNGGVDGYPPGVPSVKTAARTEATYVRYAWVILAAPAAARYRGSGFHRHLFDYVRVYPSAVTHQVWPLAIACDPDRGKYLYMAVWEGAGLRVRVYDIDQNLDQPVTSPFLLNGVSSFDIQMYTYWASVKTLADRGVSDSGRLFSIHGRWGNADANKFVVYEMATSQYYNWLISYGRPSPAATDWIAGFRWLSYDEIYLWANTGGGACNLYETRNGGGSWTNLGAMTFQVDDGAVFDHPDYAGELVIGNRAAGGANRCRYSLDRGRNFYDVSAGLPVGNGINVIRIPSERL